MRRYMLGIATAGLLAIGAPAAAASLDVMTQNQYVGTDLIGIVTQPDFNAAVVAALKDRAASMPTERARALAAEIGKRNPHLVSLQEVYRFTCVDTNPYDHAGCEDQQIAGAFTDQLAETLAALGGRYVAAAKVVNIDLPAMLHLPPPADALPGIPITLDDGTIIYVGVTDRDVILARRGVPFRKVNFAALNAFNADLCKLPSADGCNYQAAASAPLAIPGLPPINLRFERGFVGVDAVVSGKPYRFVATHLETQLYEFGATGRYAQSAQAYELIGTLQALNAFSRNDATLVAGDINSDPREGPITAPPGMDYLGISPYWLFRGAGYTDAWRKATSSPGWSCCQAADLLNVRSILDQRYDMILSLTLPKKVLDARLYGDRQSDKTLPRPFGLWPSDHAAVGALLMY